MSIAIIKTPNFSNLRLWSNTDVKFDKNLAATSNFGNKLKNDIDLLSKKSVSKKKRKLQLINDIDDEENKINEKFYDDFLNTLNKDEFNLKKKEENSDKKKFTIHQVQKKIYAKLLKFNQNKFNFSPTKNNITRNNHHLKTTFESHLKVTTIKKMSDNIKKNEEENNSNNSDIRIIENLKSLDYKNKNLKFNEMIKEENTEHEIDINSNHIINKKDYIISGNIKKISNISKTGNQLENINTKRSSENKEFLVNVKKKKKYFCCIPIY